MPDILRDPFWQFIGAVFAILAVAVTLFLYSVDHRFAL